jgi:hypothetical protein
MNDDIADIDADIDRQTLSRRHFLIAGTLAFGGALCGGAHAAPRLGTHGMVLFGGRDGLYGYHLAMFHAPHDRQVLLRLSATDPALDTTLRQALADRPVLWTLSPERFDLDRFAPAATNALNGFKADIVLGHFERGGRTVHANVALRVDRVIAFRPLATAASASTSWRYDLVGDGHERFLIKRIEQRPDFDQIVSLRTTSRRKPRSLTLDAEAGLRSPTMEQLADALLRQTNVVATDLVALYDDRADLE